MKKITVFFTCFLISIGLAIAQNRSVSGTVTDETGDAVIGASIVVTGFPNAGTATDINGTFTLSVPAGAKTLMVSYVGMVTQVVDVAPTVRVVLKTDAQTLDEVVVVAYGTSMKEAVTGAVSTVSAQSIEKRTLTSIAGVLDGQAAGVLVNNSGSPGSNPTVRIRGFSTVNGDNSPLYVIDGVPLSGNVTDLNSQDVENISVLKDAASAALFGSRAANGVILITTKQGRKNKGLSLNINAYTGVYNRGIPEYDVLNAKEFMETMWTGFRNYLVSNPDSKDASGARYTQATAAPVASRDLVSTYLKYNIFDKPADQLFDGNGKLTANINPKYNDLNWWDGIERAGFRQDYTVSGDATGEKSKVYFSLGYLDEKTNIKWADYQRMTGRINTTFTPKKWLSGGFSLNGSYQNYSNINNAGAIVNPISYVRSLAPIYPIYEHDENGDIILKANGEKQYDSGATLSRPQNLGRHLIWELDLDRDNTLRTTLGSNAFVDAKFLNDFHFIVKGDVSVRNQERRTYNNSEIGDGKGQGRTGRTVYRYLDYTAMEQLTWDKYFGKHHADILLGHENYSQSYVYTYLFKTKEVYSNKYELVNFTEMTTTTGYDNNLRGESYLSRARYSYDGKYYAEAALRRDAVSRFHPDNRWGNFWSFGASWSIHKESFMASLDYINMLKLRFSYGEVGNDASAATYAYMGLYTNSQNAKTGAAYKSQNDASNIKWESTNSSNIALEGRLFNKVNFTVEYYNKLSHDLIFSVYNPLSAGATSTTAAVSTQLKNIGDVSNKGVELSIDVDVLKTRDWLWNVSFTGAYQKNTVLTLPEQNRKDGIISGTKKIMEGHSLYSYWLYQFAGVDRLTGDALYEIDNEKFYVGEEAVEGKTKIADNLVTTINGKHYTRDYRNALRDWSGSSLPDYFGSFGSSVSWKNLSASFLCTWSIGGKVYDGPYNSLISVTSSPSATHRDILKAWNGAPAGMTESSTDRLDPNGIPAVDWYLRNLYYTASATNHLWDASYLSIRNVNLSYRLPKAWCNKVDLSDVSLSLSGENLYTFTSMKGLNPQQSLDGVTEYVMNYNRSISLGLNVKF